MCWSFCRRALLTQEGICLTLDPSFHFLEVAYPYVARRLLTDEDPALRDRLFQVPPPPPPPPPPLSFSTLPYVQSTAPLSRVCKLFH